MLDVLLCTSEELGGLPDDDSAFVQALAAEGLSTRIVPWTAPDMDWASARCVVPRSTWDYPYRVGEYSRWLDHVEGQSLLLNPAHLQQWNLHKGYLRELQEEGVRILPGLPLQRGTQLELEQELEARGWDEFVIKPAVGATARETRWYPWSQLEEGKRHLDRLLRDEDVLLQPFIPSVIECGELSLVHIDGRYSHTVRKRAAAGDWRVQDDFGGTAESASPEQDELDLAARALAALPEPPLYARVDIVRDLDLLPAVIELELIEPVLYFGWRPACASQMARSIARRLQEHVPGQTP